MPKPKNSSFIEKLKEVTEEIEDDFDYAIDDGSGLSYIIQQENIVNPENLLIGNYENKADDYVNPLPQYDIQEFLEEEIQVNQKRQTDHEKKKERKRAAWKDRSGKILNIAIKKAYPSAFHCSVCDIEVGQPYRCLEDCKSKRVFCEKCCLQVHYELPLHRCEKWNSHDGCFELINISYFWKNDACDDPMCDAEKFEAAVVIVDERGRQFQDMVEFCKCQEEAVTLVSNGLWPSSPQKPRVAFTMGFMENLRALILNGGGNVKLQTFTQAFQKGRDGLYATKNQYWHEDLYRVIDWECVLEFMVFYKKLHTLELDDQPCIKDLTKCQACPAPEEVTTSHPLQTAMDGNFSLCLLKRNNEKETSEPLLSEHFFAPQAEVDNYVKMDDAKKDEGKSCGNNFQASSVIRSKNKTDKLKYTGTFAAVCGHDFPLAILNLKHGERVGYPLYMLTKKLSSSSHVSYDLGCQLIATLKKRNIEFEGKLAVPLFHVLAHKLACQILYSPRNIPFMGLFDGENIERLWNYLGGFKCITKAMLEAHRHDLLELALMYYGEMITRRLGRSLTKKFSYSCLLKAEMEFKINLTLTELKGVSLKDVEQWDRQEMDTAVRLIRKKRKNDDMDSYSAYSMILYKYFKACESCEDPSSEADKEINEETRSKLESQLLSAEKKMKLPRRWDQADATYEFYVKQAWDQERLTRLRVLKDVIVEYDFMILLLKKYADGQALAKRISRKLCASSGKVTKQLKFYNDLPDVGSGSMPFKLQRAEVLKLDAPVWSHLSPTELSAASHIPLPVRRSLIDMFRLAKRAEEQSIHSMNDMKKYMSNLMCQESMTKSRIQLIDSIQENSKQKLGQRAMYSKFLGELQGNIQSLSKIIATTCGETASLTLVRQAFAAARDEPENEHSDNDSEDDDSDIDD